MIVAGILSPIENALAWLLEHLHDTVGLSWGWSIVALTIIVRICLVPIMVKQIHSMQRMQAHLPEMKALQQKYKGDRQRLNEELMKFYKENEINPAASCLPMLVQIPVFFALYFVLQNFTKHVTALPSELHWLIVPNITAHVTEHWSGYVLLVLYLGSQVGYAYFGTPPNIPKKPAHPVHGRAVLRPAVREPLPGGPAHVLDDDQPLDRRPGDHHPADGAEAGSPAQALVAHSRPRKTRPRRLRTVLRRRKLLPRPPQSGRARRPPPRRVKRKKKKGGR